MLLDRRLREAGLDRAAASVNNMVKHFKWAHAAGRRLHKKPSRLEQGAFLPWLE